MGNLDGKSGLGSGSVEAVEGGGGLALFESCNTLILPTS